MPSGVLLKLNFGLRRAIVGRNSIPLVSKTSQFSSTRSLVRSSMAASSSKAVFGDVHIDDMIATCGNGLEFSKPSAVFFSDRSRSSCLKSSVKMRNRELPNSRLVCGNFMLDAMRGNGKANNLVVGTLLKNLYSSSSVCFSAGAAQDVSFDGNSRKEQVVDFTVVSGQYVLLSSVCFNYFSSLLTHFRVIISLKSITRLWYKCSWFPVILNWFGSSETRVWDTVHNLANEIRIQKGAILQSLICPILTSGILLMTET